MKPSASKTARAAKAAKPGSAVESGAFTGFADDKLGFFRKLAKNQDRAWFAAHKAEYEEGWARPMQALLDEVRALVDDDYPYCELAEPKVFRIQRDVRFSKDKSPYKTHVAGVVTARGRGGEAMTEVPAAIYLSVGLDGIEAGSGQYMMSPPQLERFRAALLDDKRGAEVARACKKLTAAGYSIIAAETLKNVPRGVDPEHPRADLLKLKGLVAMAPAIDAKLLVGRGLASHLAGVARAAASMVSWLVATTAV
jgi:uncharacterized protein (TIGR02453 family)